MLMRSCTVCKIVGAIAIIGALNWGLVALFNFNLVEQIFGGGMLTRLVYILVGLSGVMLLVSYFYVCPACKNVKAA
jgi:uncharacterized membrane protein YuzA (DUF378 family)